MRGCEVHEHIHFRGWRLTCVKASRKKARGGLSAEGTGVMVKGSEASGLHASERSAVGKSTGFEVRQTQRPEPGSAMVCPWNLKTHFWFEPQFLHF